MPSTTENTKKHEELIEKFVQLRLEALRQGVSDEQCRKTFEESPEKPNSLCKLLEKVWSYLLDPAHKVHVLVVLFSVAIGLFIACYDLWYDVVFATPCIVDPSILSDEFCRPLVNCSMCMDVVSVPEERNLSQEDFYQKYAFTGRPVLVKEAIANWTAMTHFSFKFFKNLYKKNKGSLAVIEENCQFFPYETEFITLEEALNMSDDRAALKPGEQPWYIGWSNCHDGVRKQLRKHYERPYFLPSDSESVAEDWIFMGGPGLGAAIHLDYVERPSWQAQISGTKTWLLVPSPECETQCHSFNVTVHKGDIIVVDTNIWYHSTVVHPGEISITIGSEFD